MTTVEIGRDEFNQPIIIQYDTEYSLKDFTNRDLSTENLNNRVIYKSCFSQSQLDSACFSNDLVGVTFHSCNLDNCIVPEGNFVDEICSIRRILSLEDGDYLVDKNNNILEKL